MRFISFLLTAVLMAGILRLKLKKECLNKLGLRCLWFSTGSLARWFIIGGLFLRHPCVVLRASSCGFRLGFGQVLVGANDFLLSVVVPVVVGNIGEEDAAPPTEVRAALILLKSFFRLAWMSWD